MKTTAPWRKALAAALCLCLVSWGAEPLWAQAAADVSAAEDADAPAALPVQLPDFAPAGLPNLSAGSALENLSVPAERLSLPEAQPQSPEAAAQPAAALEGNASAPEATRSAPIPAALASAHRAKSAAPKTLSKMRSARTTILRLARSLKALASPAARSRDSSSDLNAQTRNAAAAFDGSTSVAGAAVEAGGRPELPESVGSGRPKPTDSGSFGRAVPGALSGRMFAPGAMRLSGAELTVAEHEKVINPVIAEAFAQGRAKLVEPDTEDYELLDPEGDYAKQDTKIYLIKMDKRDFVRRAKRLARAAGIAAPLDIVVHPGPDRNQVYYFALRRRLLERMDDEGRGLIAKHEIYHLQNPEKTETDVQEAAPLPEFRMGALARVKDAFVSMWTFTCGIRRMMRGDAELKPFTQKYRKAILAARAFLIADAALYLGLGYLTGRLVDFAGAAHLHRLLFPFLSLMALTFLADLLYFGVELTHTLITQRTCVRYVKDIRDHLFAHLSSLSLNFFHRNKPTELAPRLGDDVNLLDTKNIDIPILIPYHLFELAMSTAMMLWTNWHVGLMIMGSLPLFALLSSKISDILSRLNERYTNKHAAMIGYATDVFSIMESVKIFGIEKEAAKHFSASVVDLLKVGESQVKAEAWYHVLSSSLGEFSTKILIVFIGTLELFMHGHPSVGTIMALQAYALAYDEAISGLSDSRTSYMEADGGSQRVMKLLAAKPEITDKPGAEVLPDVQGRIEFRHVDFSYPGSSPLLKDLSFAIEPGQAVAFVGASGVGKSTIIQLMSRLYDPQKGQILIDGKNLKDIQRASYTKRLAIVPQDGGLFRGSIRDNLLAVKPDANNEEIQAAIAAAQAKFVNNPRIAKRGLDTDVSQLSGGERQRISIVRALLRDAKILFLDEATSALDNKTEGAFQRVLQRLMRGRTTVMIAHRLTTVKKADKIFVLDEGRIAESGTHDELMTAKGKYYELWNAEETPHDAAARPAKEPKTEPAAPEAPSNDEASGN